MSWSSGSTVELRVCGSLKMLPFTCCVRTPFVRRAARLKNDLLHARPVYGVKARHFPGGFGNRSRRDYTVGACMMHRRTYCIVCTATLVVLSSRIGILIYVNKPKVGDKDELKLSETVPRAPPSTKV